MSASHASSRRQPALRGVSARADGPGSVAAPLMVAAHQGRRPGGQRPPPPAQTTGPSAGAYGVSAHPALTPYCLDSGTH
jgi:hypothetical protein